jgi:hypothetical protein
MTKRKHSPIHDFWHPRVEGQIRDAIYSHPEWFSFASERDKRTMINSLAKRIVGEIAAAGIVAAERAEVVPTCPIAQGDDGAAKVPSDGGEVVRNCVPSDAQNAEKSAPCDCRRCLAERDEHIMVGNLKLPLSGTRMVVCAICDNKRCPHATDHDYPCTGSNEPGQAGSVYE